MIAQEAADVGRRDLAAYASLVRAFQTRPVLPGRADVDQGAAALRDAAGGALGQDVLQLGAGRAWLGMCEGRTWRLEVAPGAVSVRYSDDNRAERAAERARGHARAAVDAAALYTHDDLGYSSGLGYGEFGPDAHGELDPPDGPPGRAIVEWSARSRARMFTSVARLDLSGWMAVDDGTTLAMVTLTYPGDWLAVAPTGRAVKLHLDRFRKRWLRAIGPWRTLWKLEFQRRGAPHVHLLLRVPALVGADTFEAWLSRTWADVVQADDEWCGSCGAGRADCGCPFGPSTERVRHLAAGTAVDFDQRNMSDPRRVAVYFLGHSSKHTDGKEYQHTVPEAWRAPGAGPGRFWGSAGLDAAVGTVVVGAGDALRVERALRMVARARAERLRAAGVRAGRDPGRRRPLRSLGGRGRNHGGTVVVNDGPRLAADLARMLRPVAVSSSAARLLGTVPATRVGGGCCTRCDQRHPVGRFR